MSGVRAWIAEARPAAWAIRSAHPSLDALEAVLDLHKPRDAHGTTVCAACSVDEPESGSEWGDDYREGAVFFIEYPCPTVLAIEEQLT